MTSSRSSSEFLPSGVSSGVGGVFCPESRSWKIELLLVEVELVVDVELTVETELFLATNDLDKGVIPGRLLTGISTFDAISAEKDLNFRIVRGTDLLCKAPQDSEPMDIISVFKSEKGDSIYDYTSVLTILTLARSNSAAFSTPQKYVVHPLMLVQGMFV
jgi:hypothetical protein